MTFGFKFSGEPDRLKIWYRTNFRFNSTETKNIRLKWLAACINFDFISGKVDFFLNGKQMEGKQTRNATLPSDAGGKPLIVRIGKLYTDGTPLIGKIVDINMWDR